MEPEHEYEVLRLFITSYRATCILNESHRIRPGDRVARLQRADNPMLPMPGVACLRCIKGMPRAAA